MEILQTYWGSSSSTAKRDEGQSEEKAYCIDLGIVEIIADQIDNYHLSVECRRDLLNILLTLLQSCGAATVEKLTASGSAAVPPLWKIASLMVQSPPPSVSFRSSVSSFIEKATDLPQAVSSVIQNSLCASFSARVAGVSGTPDDDHYPDTGGVPAVPTPGAWVISHLEGVAVVAADKDSAAAAADDLSQAAMHSNAWFSLQLLMNCVKGKNAQAQKMLSSSAVMPSSSGAGYQSLLSYLDKILLNLASSLAPPEHVDDDDGEQGSYVAVWTKDPSSVVTTMIAILQTLLVFRVDADADDAISTEPIYLRVLQGLLKYRGARGRVDINGLASLLLGTCLKPSCANSDLATSVIEEDVGVVEDAQRSLVQQTLRMRTSTRRDDEASKLRSLLEVQQREVARSKQEANDTLQVLAGMSEQLSELRDTDTASLLQRVEALQTANAALTDEVEALKGDNENLAKYLIAEREAASRLLAESSYQIKALAGCYRDENLRVQKLIAQQQHGRSPSPDDRAAAADETSASRDLINLIVALKKVCPSALDILAAPIDQPISNRLPPNAKQADTAATVVVSGNPLIPAQWIPRHFCLEAVGPRRSVFNLKPLARAVDSQATLYNITIGEYTGDATIIASVCQGLQDVPSVASNSDNATVGAIKLSNDEMLRIGGWDNTDWHLADPRGINESLGVRLTHKAGDRQYCRYDRNGWVLHQEFPCDATAGSVPHIVESQFYNNPEDGCSVYLRYAPAAAACPILNLSVLGEEIDPHRPRVLGGLLLFAIGIPLCMRGLRMAKPGAFLFGFVISGIVAFELMAQLAFHDSNYYDWDDSGRGLSGVLPHYTLLEIIFLVSVSLLTAYVVGKLAVRCLPFIVAIIGAWAGCLLCWVIFDAVMTRMASESGYGGGGGSMEQHENLGYNTMDPDEETIAWLMGPRSVDILKHGSQHSLYATGGGGGIARYFLYISMSILSFIFALLSLESIAPFIIMATALVGAALIVQGFGTTFLALKGVQPSQSLSDLVIESPSDWSDWLVLLLLLVVFAWGVAIQSKNYDKVMYRTNSSMISPRPRGEGEHEELMPPTPESRRLTPAGGTYPGGAAATTDAVHSKSSMVEDVVERFSRLPEERRGEVLRRLLSGDKKNTTTTISLSSFMTHRVIRSLYAKRVDDDGDDALSYTGICPSCRKPLSVDISCHPQPLPQEHGLMGQDTPRYAYVTVLYGTKPSYFLQALICGWGLRSMGSAYDTVLVHTRDVPPSYLACLGRVFTRLHPVGYIPCCTRLLAGEQSSRFDWVFTKLRCLELDQLGYSKIVLVDTDTLCVKNMDDLFDLQAPAAMKRGAWQPEHGTEFRAEWLYSKGWWGNSTGVNAGIMLLAPDTTELEGMIEEITDDTHPEHCYCNGPEQDYLSRYYPQWRHISCRYNFQLHHLYFHCMDSPFYHNIEWNTLRKEDIKMFHYSTETKPSDWVLEKLLASVDGTLPESLESFALTMRSRLPSYVGICAVDPAVTLGMSPSSWSFPYGTYMSANWVRTRYWYEWACQSPTVSTCNSSNQETSSVDSDPGSAEDPRSSPGWQLREMPECISRAALQRADSITVAAFEDWYQSYLALRDYLNACGLALDDILLRGLCGSLCAGCNEPLLTDVPRAFPSCMGAEADGVEYCSYCCESWESMHMWDEDYNLNSTVDRVWEKGGVDSTNEHADHAIDDHAVVPDFEIINSYRVSPRHVANGETWVVVGRVVHAGRCPAERQHVGTATWTAESFRMSFLLGLNGQVDVENLPSQVLEMVDSRDNTIIAVDPRGAVTIPSYQRPQRQVTALALGPGSTAKFTISVGLSPCPHLKLVEVQQVDSRGYGSPYCVYKGDPSEDANAAVLPVGPNYHAFIGDYAEGVNSLYDLFVTPE
ncbi:hypothetical protein FOL46_005062 [Perkinsus olseni]|uniref:Uncharacterized protein n=1 Tax=Perkinsus olseni TaxID=32597 RepID=A0A7J6LUK0_PEROL|nr:hypothetical protein FOL46_005062 [Perkinsus olseni]